MGKKKTLTTAHGNPIADNQNSLTVGPRGALLMQDYQLLEKMGIFNRERVVQAKGSGAFGCSGTFLNEPYFCKLIEYRS